VNGAVITALNEADTIDFLVSDLKAKGLEVIVIDDGSTDATGDVAKMAGAIVVRHSESHGIGKSLMEAWRLAIGRKWDYTLQIDAGGSHNPDDLPRFAGDVMIGSRFLPPSEYIGRGWRKYASRLTAILLNFATHKRVSDWTSGYRVFSRDEVDILLRGNYMTNMHTWQIEVLAYALENNLTVAEFPISYRAGQSTMKWKTVDDLIKVYLWIIHR